MMNKYLKLTILLQLLWGGSLLAQLPSQYTFTKTSGTLVDISGTGTAGPTGDDVISASQTLGFNFNYCGASYSTFKVSTNGFVTLGTNALGALAGNTLNSATNFPIIAPLWDDNESDTYFELSGTAGTQVLTIQWSNVSWRYNAATPGYSYQLKLYEGTDRFEFIYGDSLAANNTPSASIGFNSAANTYLSVDGTGTNTSSSTESAAIATWPGAGIVYQFDKPTGDFLPPVITNTAISPSAFSCTAVAKTISADISDNVAVDSAYFTYSVNGGAPTQVLMTGGPTYTGTVPAVLGNISVIIYAKDAAGNMSSTSTTYTNGGAGVNAGIDQTINSGTSATLVAYTKSGVALKITEITQYNTGTGQTNPYPAYITGTDYIEITNLGAMGVDLSGMKIIAYTGTTVSFTYTFPNGSILKSGAVLVAATGTGTTSIANNYYNMGNTVDNTSGTGVGYTLRANDGTIIDAVATNGYVFPAVANVNATDWSGTVASSTNLAGIIRSTTDTNNASDWALSSAVLVQTIGSLNPGLTIGTMPSIVWTPGNVANDTLITGNLTSTTTYTATVNDGICTMTDDVTVNVITPTAPVADFVASATTTNTGAPVTLTDLSTNIPTGWAWTITPATFTYINATNANSQNPQVTFSAAGVYTVSLIATNPAGSDTETKTNYITVNISYCNSAATNTGDTDIGSVTVNTFTNGNATPTTNNTTANALYTDYTALTPTDLSLNNNYPISLSQITSGATFYAARVNVFIDFNQNGLFELNEKIFTDATATGTPTVNGNFTVPATATLGTTRMRFILNENGAATDSSCGTYNYGETEDYMVNIIPAGVCSTPAEAGVLSGPATTLLGSATAYNTTGSTGTITWQYSYDGATWITLSGNGTINNITYTNIDTAFVRVIANSPNCPPDTSNTVQTIIVPNMGDLITNPLVITGTGYTHTDSLIRYTSDYTGTNAQPSPDVYYQYVVPSCLDSITFSLCGTTVMFDTYIHAINSDGSHIASDDDACGVSGGLSALNLTGLTTGDTIYFVVEGYLNDLGTYTVQVTESFGTLPTFTALADTSVCAPFDICITTSATSVTWSNGDTTTCAHISAPGTYIVSMTTLNCTVQDTFVVNFFSLDAQFTAPDTVYKDSVANFTANSSGLTYQWSFGPAATYTDSTSMSTTAQFGTVGNATATLIVSNGSCSDTVTKNITVLLLSNNENQWNTMVSLYPNPNNGQFVWSLNLDQKETVAFEITDVTGKVVYQNTVSGKEIKENVQLNVSKGIYMWKAQGKSGFSTGKLIVE